MNPRNYYRDLTLTGHPRLDSDAQRLLDVDVRRNLDAVSVNFSNISLWPPTVENLAADDKFQSMRDRIMSQLIQQAQHAMETLEAQMVAAGQRPEDGWMILHWFDIEEAGKITFFCKPVQSRRM